MPTVTTETVKVTPEIKKLHRELRDVLNKHEGANLTEVVAVLSCIIGDLVYGLTEGGMPFSSAMLLVMENIKFTIELHGDTEDDLSKTPVEGNA